MCLCSILLELDHGDSRVCFWTCMIWNCLRFSMSTYVLYDGGYKDIVGFFGGRWRKGEKGIFQLVSSPNTTHIIL